MRQASDLRARSLPGGGLPAYGFGHAIVAAAAAALGASCVHSSAVVAAGGRPVDGAAFELAGRKVELQSLRGKVVLIDFFATWCEPCKKGLPVTQALVEKHAARGLAGWAVSLDDQASLVGPFVAGLGLRMAVLFDEQGRLADELGVEKLPCAVLLDRAGAVRFVRTGAAAEDEAEVERAVEQLLREPASHGR